MQALDSLNEAGELFGALAPMSAVQVAALLEPLDGKINTSSHAIILADSRFVRQAVNDRLYTAHRAFQEPEMNDSQATKTVGAYEMWGQVYGSWAQFSSDDNAHTTDRNVGGLVVGVDALANDLVRFGAVAGFGRSTFDVGAVASDADSDNFTFGDT
ncbi:autotransporter domain-containing protein [Pseudovibrio sp. Tun.PSC04-5.I4]|uniref:autotransporter outer membrane beta-barrel domain-containing protein n=1 Tax=Pseudovibrio sp. Tun.PSC04-5.I4 TaxID=1798213 RepID=UPI000A8942A4|nr:autotransporter domain-containing protein [Pseudovibrio sp. Tun.PSC04-5.I4]